VDHHRPLCHIHPLLNKQWDAYFLKAVAHRREERFASSEEMAAALEELAAHWHADKTNACRIQTGTIAGDRDRSAPPLQREPIRVAGINARRAFALNELFQPIITAAAKFRKLEGNIIEDVINQLIWQQKGAPFLMDEEGAKRYVRELNRLNHEGLNKWRLPTVNELLTLIGTSTASTVVCGHEPFQIRHDRLWSCDRRTPTTVWFVNIDPPYVERADWRCYNHVLAVYG